MSDSQTLFAALRATADAEATAAIERLVESGADRDLARINVLAFAAAQGLDEERIIAAFLYAAQLGIFELSWDVVCPTCRGVLDITMSLKDVHKEPYECALCSRSFELTLDEMVEVVFTVSPRVRKIAAHDPQTLPFWDYYRQVFWSSAVDLSDHDLETLIADFTLDARVLGPGEQMSVSIEVPEGWVIVFEPVSHFGHYMKVAAERTAGIQELALTLETPSGPTETTPLKSGPVQLSITNRTGARALPVVWHETRAFDALVGKRRPNLTAKRIFTNQTFRDLHRTDTLAVDQGLKIVSLTFLFTDLKGSTELYARVGDLVAYELVREHFRLLTHIVAAEGGAVVKTIGDAVMATFPASDRALAAALRMRELDPHGRQRHTAGGPAAQNRHSRGSLPCRHAQRPAGLLRPDREYRGSYSGAGGVACHLRQQAGRRLSAVVGAAPKSRYRTESPERVAQGCGGGCGGL